MRASWNVGEVINRVLTICSTFLIANDENFQIQLVIIKINY